MDFLNEQRLSETDLETNPANRVAICLCIDTSFSMIEENRIKHVNNSVRKFIEDSKNDEYAVDAIDLCIVTFGGKPEVVQPFANVSKINFKDLSPGGDTPLAQAVNMAMNAIKERRNQYSAHGITSYKPWLIIMSDGEATDDVSLSASWVREAIQNREVKVKCIDMSSDKKNSLSAFTPDGEVSVLTDFQIDNFFEMLSRSAAGLSTAVPGLDDDYNFNF